MRWKRERGRGLGGRKIDDHHVPEFFRLRKIFDVALHAIDRLAGCFHNGHNRWIGQLTNFIAGSNDRAGPQPRFHRSKKISSVIEQLRRDGTAVGPHASGFVGQSTGANVVAAHDDLCAIDQIQLRERFEGSHQSNRLDGLSAQRC